MPDVGSEQGRAARASTATTVCCADETQPHQRDAGQEQRQARPDEQKASEVEAGRRFLAHVRDEARDQRDARAAATGMLIQKIQRQLK